jgi:hypothetical protein
VSVNSVSPTPAPTLTPPPSGWPGIVTILIAVVILLAVLVLLIGGYVLWKKTVPTKAAVIAPAYPQPEIKLVPDANPKLDIDEGDLPSMNVNIGLKLKTDPGKQSLSKAEEID